MKLHDKSKEVVNKISMLTGLKKEDIKNVFESLTVLSILDYLNSNYTDIPYLGTLEIKYATDKIENKVKKAILECNFQPCDYLNKNIGQINDGETSDIEKKLKMRSQAVLGEYLNKE